MSEEPRNINNLKKIRVEKGKTQVEVAILCSLNPSGYSRIEIGKPCLKSTARRIADALNVEVETAFPNYEKMRGY